MKLKSNKSVIVMVGTVADRLNLNRLSNEGTHMKLIISFEKVNKVFATFAKLTFSQPFYLC